MSDLMQKLAMSKAIMDKHNEIGRGQARNISSSHISSPELESYNAPEATYNLPQEFMQESSSPVSNVTQPITKDKILTSKLPDEIKRLMIENPIVSSNPLMGGGPVLSDELVEKASKLMGTNKTSNQPQQKSQQIQGNQDLRQMMKEVVQEVLKEHGLISESTSNADEVMMIKVGKHLFEGKISKIKKIK